MRLKFSIRDVLLVTLIVAMFFGWQRSQRQAEQRIAQLEKRAQDAKIDKEWDADRLRMHAERTSYHSQGLMSGANLENVDFKGGKLAGGYYAFRRTVFNGANLQDASLTGGNSAFQGARFFRATLRAASLSGGTSSFYLSSFIEADLSGAVLAGGVQSFKGATFQNAKLVNARIVCGAYSFLNVDLDGATFQAADLSALSSKSLQSCYFQTPPLYDALTKFPKDFDPREQGWKLADSAASD